MSKEVVYFTAAWCQPCQKIKPTFKDLEAAHGDQIQFTMVDVDQDPQLASQYKVEGIPAFFFKVDDEIIASFNGCKIKKLREEVESLLNF
jgi:thioredoxin 1